MASIRPWTLSGALLGVLVLIAVVSMLGRPRVPAPPPEPRGHTSLEPAPPAEPAPAPAPRISRSKGQSDWTFFFRPGDTLSRMADGTPLGVVVRLERMHSFPDGSTGPAYALRSADQQESVFDADELERSARVETIRETARPAVGAAPR
jgi:hypothetical protein